MQNMINFKSASAVLLVIAGLFGLLFGSFVFSIFAFGIILLGIFNIYKKSFDSGIILIIVGIAVIILSRFLGRIIHYISLACVISGIVLFIIYGLSEKKGN